MGFWDVGLKRAACLQKNAKVHLIVDA